MPLLPDVKPSLITHATPSRTLTVERWERTIPIRRVVVNYARFDEACRQGCPNFNRRWSCPPLAPTFRRVCRQATKIRVVAYRVPLAAFCDSSYASVKAASAVARSRLVRDLRDAQALGSIVLGSGACRACNPCGLAVGPSQPCKKPGRRIYSLEATGVDVGALVQTAFGFDLEWYTKAGRPNWICAVGGILKA